MEFGKTFSFFGIICGILSIILLIILLVLIIGYPCVPEPFFHEWCFTPNLLYILPIPILAVLALTTSLIGLFISNEKKFAIIGTILGTVAILLCVGAYLYLMLRPMVVY